MIARIWRGRDGATAEQERDKALVRAVHQAMLRYDPIRATDSPIRVTTKKGVVTLSGIVRTRTMKAMAERLARRVPGVKDVRNELLTDTDIETNIGMELAQHDGLSRAGGTFLVKSIRGTVYLMGDIAADSVAEAETLKEEAEKIVEQVVGVTRVINNLVARERGQVIAAASQEAAAGGPSSESAAKLAELRERRTIWAQRAAASGKSPE